MLNENSQRTLSQLFMRIIEGENKVEILRKCLCENYDFSPRVLFRSLCRVYSDSILPKDLKEFTAQNGEEGKDQECYLLVRQYSSLQNGRLSEEDFSHLVLSATNDTLPYLVSQRLHVQDLKVGVKYSFLSLLKEELKLHREAEALKVQLFQDPDFSLWKAFENLNSGNKGYVSEADITNFLQKRGRFISQNDYDALMRRIDLEDDLVISYNEFLEALIPLQVPRHNFRPSEEKPASELRRQEDNRLREKSGEKSEQESASFGNKKSQSTEKTKKEDVDEDRPFKAEELDASCRAVKSENLKREGSQDEDLDNLKGEKLESRGNSKAEKEEDHKELEDEGNQSSEIHFEERENDYSEHQERDDQFSGNQEREDQFSDNQERVDQYSDNQDREEHNSIDENFKDDEQGKSEELKDDDLEKLSDEDN